MRCALALRGRHSRARSGRAGPCAAGRHGEQSLLHPTTAAHAGPRSNLRARAPCPVRGCDPSSRDRASGRARKVRSASHAAGCRGRPPHRMQAIAHTTCVPGRSVRSVLRKRQALPARAPGSARSCSATAGVGIPTRGHSARNPAPQCPGARPPGTAAAEPGSPAESVSPYTVCSPR